MIDFKRNMVINLYIQFIWRKKENPSICFVFMNPTAGNIAAEKDWDGPRYPWLGTKIFGNYLIN